MPLFEYKRRENPNDPYMINPLGVRVQVQEERVLELLKKGYILEDKMWAPTPSKEPAATELPSIEHIRDQLNLKVDMLEVTEI